MKSFISLLVIIASMATYFSSEGKNIFYFAFLMIFITSISLQKELYSRNQLPLFIAIGYLLASCLSVITNFNDISADMIQSLAYPLILIFLVLGGWRVIFDTQGIHAKLVIILFTTNASVAFLSVAGLISELPLFGEITRGRFIFGTSIPSSAGLIWNVNYFAITQLVGFWLSYFIFSKNSLNKRWVVPLAFIALSIPLGSSRSITLSFLLSILIFLYIFSSKGLKKIILAVFAFSVFFSSSFYAYIINSDEIATSLRLDRGLNGRDELWEYGFNLFLDSPLFGMGSIERMKQLLTETAGLHNTTVQNSILFTMIRIGSLGTFFMISFLIYSFYKFITAVNKTKFDAALFCCFFALILDSMVRSYSLGGVGLSPFIMSLIATYFASHEFNSHASNSCQPREPA